MKRKIKKGRSAAIVTLGLAAVSLVSVGFSAWIIQTATIEETTEITVNVANVNNQTIDITDVALTADSTFEFDALKTDNQGEIIWGKDTQNAEDDAGEDLTWGFKFSLTPNGKVFQGISLGSTSSDVTEQDPTSVFVDYKDGTIIDIPTTFMADTYLPLVPNDALDNMQADDTKNIYLDVVQASNVFKVESTSNYDISVKIEAKNVGDGEEVVLSYNFTVEMKAKWGSKYLGFNPCLCDGADADVNQVFEDAETTLPTVDSIMTDLTNLNTELNGKQIKHIIRHDPASPVIISPKQ